MSGGLDAAVGARFAALGATFRRPPPLPPPAVVERVRGTGVVRAAGRSLVDWARGLWGAPGAAAENAGSQLTAPLHVWSGWRRGGASEAERVLRAELAGQARRVQGVVDGLEVMGERTQRITPGTGPFLIAADVRRLGAQGALERHTYETFQLLPDVALAAAGGSIATARRLAAAEQLAETRWVRSAHNAAQAARLADDLARQHAWSTTTRFRLIAGPGGAPFRDVQGYIDVYGGSVDDWAKVSARPYTTVDGRKWETHFVQDLRTGAIHNPKEKPTR